MIVLITDTVGWRGSDTEQSEGAEGPTAPRPTNDILATYKIGVFIGHMYKGFIRHERSETPIGQKILFNINIYLNN